MIADDAVQRRQCVETGVGDKSVWRTRTRLALEKQVASDGRRSDVRAVPMKTTPSTCTESTKSTSRKKTGRLGWSCGLALKLRLGVNLGVKSRDVLVDKTGILGRSCGLALAARGRARATTNAD